MTENNTTSEKKAYYIVTNAQGEQFLLPYFSETFRVLMDDKDTIRDILNCLLGLDNDHEIIDLDYEFEKPIDVFMPEDDSARLDVWVTTRDNRYFNKRSVRFIFMNFLKRYPSGSVISRFSSQKIFLRIPGRSIARTRFTTATQHIGLFPFSVKIDIL